MGNTNQHFISRDVPLRVEAQGSPFTKGYNEGAYTRFPVAHHDGNYQADEGVLNRLEGEGRVAFRYVEPINGAARNIAGILSEDGRTLGMMPHPERAIDGDTAAGRAFFSQTIAALAA